MIKHPFWLAMLSLLVTVNVQAKCPQNAKTLFSCLTSKKKQIEVCDTGETIEYSFGKQHAVPEIMLSVLRQQASTWQWNGIGRDISYTVEIPNGDITYSVFWSFDRVLQHHPRSAGVNIILNNELKTTVHCAGKRITNNLEGLDLKPTE